METIKLFLVIVLFVKSTSGAKVIIDPPKPSYNIKETQKARLTMAIIKCTLGVANTARVCRCNMKDTRPKNGPFSIIRMSPENDHELFFTGGNNLDFDKVKTWEIKVTCEDSTDSTFSEQVTYEIDVLKNNAPDITNWPRETIDVDVASTKIGDEVYKMAATDVDNDAVEYSIESITGEVTLVKDLMTTTDTSIVLELGASDGRDTTKPFVLTINLLNPNEPPKFQGLFDITIPEDTAAGTNLIPFTVSDDKLVTLNPICDVTSHTGTFDIVYDQPRQTIKVGQAANGVSPLDFDSGPRKYVVTCEVSDGFLTSTQSFRVKVTNVNEPPVFSSLTYSCIMDETTKNGLTVSSCKPGIKVTDPENDVIANLNLIPNAANNNNFRYNSATDILTFATDTYDVDNVLGDIKPVLTMEATDAHGLKSTANIEVTVRDINDNTCVFTPKDPSFSIDQGSNVGVLGTVTATDADRTSPNNLVQIQEVSGDTKYIRVSSGGQIRYVRQIPKSQHGTSYFLTIRCKDGGNPSRSATTTVILTYHTTTTTPATTITTPAPTTATPKPATTTPKPTMEEAKISSIWDDTTFAAIFAVLAVLISALVLAGLYFLLRYCCNSPGALCADSGAESRWNCCKEPRKPTKVEPVDEYPRYNQDYKEIGWKTYDGFEDGRYLNNSRQTVGTLIGGRRALPPPQRHHHNNFF